ncbi:pyridoxamine 5'-phosphate oxidase family protein [Paracoccus sp. PARArs4]|uniref:FAD-binding oxidoreductase n=1 Tax=Paracoccus sp. PARArs4 TaxID=2853442 RepID=UPI0024A60DCE|nr:pyridoxamine 5'-phosphate oxidase family protein [Paracoccus sp. PARArs4]
MTHANPFHEAERAAQMRAGVDDVSRWAGGFVRDHLPDQHRRFHAGLPFMVLAGADASGHVWVTLVEGQDGFVTSSDPRHLAFRAHVPDDDPLAQRFAQGGDVGAVGIDLATRRRNRFSGRLRPVPDGFVIRVAQTFGNCPQYIHERSLARVPSSPGPVRRSDALDDDQIARIHAADTLFIGSGQHEGAGAASDGYDASHRGGAPGFVRVEGRNRLLIPDYMGNNFFNTIGNIMADPRVGLVFVDFATGGLLHLRGRASVDWSPEGAHDPDAWRMIRVEVEAVIDRPAALSLRWSRTEAGTRKLRVVRKTVESASITSFHLASLDRRPLPRFRAGQHLPITVQVPGQAGTSSRSYSLSGDPKGGEYRITVKREDRGLVSRHLHDALPEGGVIEAGEPSGEFVLPEGRGPVVLIGAGVGLTPMLSALHALAGTDRRTWYLHAARSGRNHAMRDEVAALVAAHPNLRQGVFYSRPEPHDRIGGDHHETGRITAGHVLALGVGPDADYMICGPAGFIADLRNGLEDAGIPPERILFETFGPGA